MALNNPKQSFSIPAIAQLVEHLTVDSADIRWSLVRFRVAGFMGMGDTLDRFLFSKNMLGDTFAHACTVIRTCATLRKTRRRTLSRKSYPHAMHEVQNRKNLGAPLPLSLTATVV